ncbi:MAG: type VI secretion system contractile sheath large subunit [Acidobacteria bacterium]|nr:type VI secretion system contractile sheath large subunit [Acidobacteriota bacterium]MBV9068589.1 type VI secretion system contractile sheath large subunit [Acidobacteriota bacterium]MBV9186737.1 type VI secretion system contractile sheath large subunit [Acidobacteriota bacterium]
MADKKEKEAAAAPAAEAEASEAAAAPAAAGEGSLLDQIVEKGKMARDESQKGRAKDLVGEFVHQILDEGMTVSRDTLAMIQAQIARIDELLSKQLNEVLHHPDFQKLEASWRGLHYFVMNTETSTRLKLRLLCATKAEIFKDLDQAIEFDQSVLFKKIYEEEYGTFGGFPFSLLIGDFEFGRHPQDMALLEKIAGVAAAAHAPFIAAASPRLFDMDAFTELGNPRDLAKLFESTELIKWRSFQAMEDSRYVTLVLPHILLRLPYGPNTVPTEDFKLVEDTDGTDHSRYLWGNAAWALGQRITNAFALYGWCAAIRGVEGGGMVTGLPAHTFKTDEGDIALKCPTELAITDRREKELDSLGFVSLCHCKGTDYAAFFGGQTTQKPKVYDTNAANANARISARLPYVLAASRFAHYLKVICRDKVGSFQTKDTLSTHLNRWISSYILGTDDAGQELKAQYPLREARIDVFDVPGKPGAYRAVAFLRPHFQLEELTASIRLVAELPPPVAA